ncbi:MAG TPA: TetR family transcriptional regulator [Azospira sp.]|nr:TetR family transcriptional regulator [Azospira sp.]
MKPKHGRGADMTRATLIDGARQAFLELGVNGASLDQVAARAGVTRGAIYWHFGNKAELLFALVEESRAKLLSRLQANSSHSDPLERLRQQWQQLLQSLQDDQVLREVVEIVLFRCEYVGPFAAMEERLLELRTACIAAIAQYYAAAQAGGTLRPVMEPQGLARDTCHCLASQLRAWLRQPGAAATVESLAALDGHLALRRI